MHGHNNALYGHQVSMVISTLETIIEYALTYIVLMCSSFVLIGKP